MARPGGILIATGLLTAVLPAAAVHAAWPARQPLSVHLASPDGTIVREAYYGDGSVVRRQAGPGGTIETIRSGAARVCTQSERGGVTVSACR
jgi:hypothetical protein